MTTSTVRVITYDSIDDSNSSGEKGRFINRVVDYFDDQESDLDDNTEEIILSEKHASNRGYSVKISKIPVETLEKQMDNLVGVVNRLFKRSQSQSLDEIVLNEIELAVEINGEGEISILGNGAKFGTKGAIKLKFKRSAIKIGN